MLVLSKLCMIINWSIEYRAAFPHVIKNIKYTVRTSIYIANFLSKIYYAFRGCCIEIEKVFLTSFLHFLLHYMNDEIVISNCGEDCICLIKILTA